MEKEDSKKALRLKTRPEELLKFLYSIGKRRFNVKGYARAIKIPRSSVYETLNILKRRGFVKRDINDNHITELGRKYIKSNRVKTHNQFKQNHCVVCGRRDILDIHHIDGNRENNKLSNLVYLCPSHHSLIHRGKSKIITEKGVLFYILKIRIKNG